MGKSYRRKVAGGQDGRKIAEEQQNPEITEASSTSSQTASWATEAKEVEAAAAGVGVEAKSCLNPCRMAFLCHAQPCRAQERQEGRVAVLDGQNDQSGNV
jgi:hypothetical protein